MLCKAFSKVLAFLPVLLSASSAGAIENPSPILVSGWPLELNETQKAVLSNDAIMESLVCPSLTRLNLVSKRSELVLLEKLEESDKSWRLTLAPKLSWWDNTPVSPEDLESFLRETLIPSKVAHGRYAWTVPPYTVSVKDRTLTLQWQQKPAFGPYVLNNQPMQKKVGTALGLQCTGGWAAEASPQGLLLKDRLNQGQNDILLSPDPKPKEAIGNRRLAFLFGDDMQGPAPKRWVDNETSCSRPLDTPIVTVVAWNPQGAATKDPKFRRAITHLTPRGALLRAGAGYLGDLVSGPILRAHPGYKRTLLVPTYDPGKADAMLNELGYRRLEDDGFRRDASGKPLEVKIQVRDREGSALLRKVMDDSFRALGIKLSFKSDGVPDGILTGVLTSWPDGDLSELLPSKVGNDVWPWGYQDQGLEQAMEAYSVSLTKRDPDFTLLEKVHDLVYKLEPFSVLMQHRVCLESQWDRGKRGKGEIVVRNPDWFRQLIGL